MFEATIALLAHQGGWDEMLMVAAPILVIAWILWIANRRASIAERIRNQAQPSDSTSAPNDTNRPTKSS